jgi:hypothetical protein
MTLTKEIDELEKGRNELESEAIAILKQIIRRVESVTGRSLSNQMELTHTVCVVKKVKDMAEPKLPVYGQTRLRDFVTAAGYHIGKYWEFETACEFFQWAEDTFEAAFKRGRSDSI